MTPCPAPRSRCLRSLICCPQQQAVTLYNRFGTAVSMDIIDTPGASQTVTPVVTGVQLDELGRLTTRSYANTVDRRVEYSEQWGAPSRIAALYNDGTSDVAVQDDYLTRDEFGRVTQIFG